MNSKVTVAVISYNQEGFIEDCLKSIKAQTYKNIDVIVIDNNSSNLGAEEKIKNISGSYGYEFKKREDRSLTKCLNEILFNINDSKYVVFIAADDIIIHNRIEMQIKILDEKSDDIAAIFGNMVQIDDDGQLLGVSKITNNSCLEFDDVFLKRHDLYSPSAMFRVDSLKKVGGYDESHKIEDLSIYLKLTKSGYGLEKVSLPFVFYRIHSNSTHNKYLWMMNEKLKIWGNYSEEAKYKKAIDNIYLEHFSNFGSTDKYQFLKLIPKVIHRIDSKYWWLGFARFFLDWRLIWY